MDASALSPHEWAALRVVLRRLPKEELLQEFRRVEPRMSDRTYMRRFEDACDSLEKKKMVKGVSGWPWFDPTADGLRVLLAEALADDVFWLWGKVQRLSVELEGVHERTKELEGEVDRARGMSRLAETSAALGVTPDLLEMILLCVMYEFGARHTLHRLAVGDGAKEKAAQNQRYPDLFGAVRQRIYEVEGRKLGFSADMADTLSRIRNTIVHQGFAHQIRREDVEAARAMLHAIMSDFGLKATPGAKP